MTRAARFAFQVVLTLIVGLTIYAALHHLGRGESGDSVAPLELQLVRLRDEGLHHRIDVYYPQVGLPFDKAIKAEVEDEAEALKEFAEKYPPQSWGATGPYSYTGGLRWASLDSDIVSLKVALSLFTGGVHGTSYVVGLNYDRVAGREVTLDDALGLIGLSLPQVSTGTLLQLSQNKSVSLLFPEGAAADPNNYRTFTISDDSVTFYLAEYQVAPYAAGILEVSFPRLAPRD